jgi:type II secretory pathway pseudopilin PulG
MKKLLVALVVVLVAGAFVYGRWPERQRRIALEAENRALQRQVDEAQARVRLCSLLGQLQGLMRAVSAQNYGEARELSSRFFDDARSEASRTPEPAFAQSLEAALGLRDAVTAALAQADSKAIEPLRQVEARLEGALGPPWPAASPAGPRAPAPSAPGAGSAAPSPR